METKTTISIAKKEHAAGRVDEAEELYVQILQHDPHQAEALHNLAILLFDQGRFQEAIDCNRRLLTIDSTSTSTWINLGALYERLNEFAVAAECYNQAISITPDSLESHFRLAVVLKEQHRFEDALAYFSEAIRVDEEGAESHFERAATWLLTENLSEGWLEYEWRWKLPGSIRLNFNQPLWNGEDISQKRILLHTEQGYGDTLQFIRYAPLVKERARHVIVACQQRLIPLVASCSGVDRVVTWAAQPEFDVYAPLLSLPRILETTIETIPATPSYVSAQPSKVALWREKTLPIKGTKIGIAWQGNPIAYRDWSRSIPLADFLTLSEIPGLQLINLQKGFGVEQLRKMSNRSSVIDLGEDVDSSGGAFLDTAAIMMNLDLVITSDSALAHLAGALGVKVWVALPFTPDWRWFLDRDDSPWYPTMRLFRQTKPGGWEEVFHRIAGALANEISTR